MQMKDILQRRLLHMFRTRGEEKGGVEVWGDTLQYFGIYPL